VTARSVNVAQVEAQAMTCDHHWISAHQPDFPDAVYWIDRCSLCGTYNGERLSEQLVELLDSRERAIRWAVTLEGENAAMEALITAIREQARLWQHASPAGFYPEASAYANAVERCGDALIDMFDDFPLVAALTGSTE
jgi:hypothetical protein